MFSREKVACFCLYIVFFLNFLGQKVLLLALAKLGLLHLSKYFNQPLRLVIVATLLTTILLGLGRKIKLEVVLFLIFSGLYMTRLYVDVAEGNLTLYYISGAELLAYFVSFAFLPFVLLASVKLNRAKIEAIRKGFFHSALLFVVGATVLYGSYLGQVGRLLSKAGEEAVISPLILSYSAALAIGLSIGYLLNSRSSALGKSYYIMIVALGSIPFLLGASRGAVMALFIPIAIQLLLRRNFKVIATVSIISVLLVFLAAEFQSVAFQRVMSIGDDIESGKSSASRLVIWKQALKQFMSNPFFGDSFVVQGRDNYPHNIFVEVLLTTGMIGFVPFFLLMTRVCWMAFSIVANHKEYAWISILFLQSFFEAMFSHAVFDSNWLWLSSALVVSFSYFAKGQLAENQALVQYSKS